MPQSVYHTILHKQAYELLGYAIYKEYGITIQDKDLERNKYGKPSLITYPNIHFSISHCQEMVACGIGERVLGVDIELIRSFYMPVLNRVCSIEEKNMIEESEDPSETFFKLWTLKESFIKAIGMGLAFPMRSVYFKITKDDKILCNQKAFEFEQYKIDKRFILSICRYQSGGCL